MLGVSHPVMQNPRMVIGRTRRNEDGVLGNVGGPEVVDYASSSTDLRRSPLQPLCVGIGKEHSRALSGRGQRGRPTDAAGRLGDQAAFGPQVLDGHGSTQRRAQTWLGLGVQGGRRGCAGRRRRALPYATLGW